ncbi:MULTISPECIES: type IV secretion system protein [Brucella]|uniref:Type IV secretion system protein n=1 Tax=Brucella tritici TaxID=94626 RepID=A0A6L3YB28_9HYPH|nr:MULTISPECIES: type IV secretion system protein [Brucella]KAB2681167.1 type IV secretion system protein [Brucella tritici]KAB2757351.1 type IV secretion system protein [Brucella anthropi]KAB2775280.1 type IV secretion system protein [Brucella anthropi]
MNGIATSILGGIDSIGNSFVSNLYMQLSYALGNVFTGMLTIYIIWWGYTILTGREVLSPIDAVFRLGRVAIIYMMFSRWGVFSETFYKLVQTIPNEVGKVVVGAVSRATGNQLANQDAIPALIDNLFQGAQTVASQVYTGSLFDIFGALLAILVLGCAIIFSGLAMAAIIAAKIILFITIALSPIFIVLWLFRWSARMAEGFLSLTTYLIITQILIYGFLGFYFSLVNLALNTATTGGENVDGMMSTIMPLVLVTIIGIYILTLIPGIASMLNGGGYLDTARSSSAYKKAGRMTFNVSRSSLRGAGGFLRQSASGRQQIAAKAASRKQIQASVKNNSAPMV